MRTFKIAFALILELYSAVPSHAASMSASWAKLKNSWLSAEMKAKCGDTLFKITKSVTGELKLFILNEENNWQEMSINNSADEALFFSGLNFNARGLAFKTTMITHKSEVMAHLIGAAEAAKKRTASDLGTTVVVNGKAVDWVQPDFNLKPFYKNGVLFFSGINDLFEPATLDETINFAKEFNALIDFTPSGTQQLAFDSKLDFARSDFSSEVKGSLSLDVRRALREKQFTAPIIQIMYSGYSHSRVPCEAGD